MYSFVYVMFWLMLVRAGLNLCIAAWHHAAEARKVAFGRCVLAAGLAFWAWALLIDCKYQAGC
jgi:hypothetical protein